jgi:hypothetical protein
LLIGISAFMTATGSWQKLLRAARLRKTFGDECRLVGTIRPNAE